MALLTSGEAIPEKLIPVLNFVLLNAAALIVVAGLASDFKEGVKLAMGSVVSGSAWSALDKFKNEGKRIVESLK